MITRLAVLAFASLAVTSAAPELHVLRTSAPDAAPTEPILVTFDRPVAGALDGAGAVDAAAFFRIEPRVPGKVEWRDPVTLRFTPAQPLARRTVYRVTVPAGLTGLDGSRLTSDYHFEVRPPGPTTVSAWSPDAWRGLEALKPQGRVRVMVDGPVDEGVAGGLIKIDFPATGCIVAHTVAMRVTAQRPATEDELKERSGREEWQGPVPPEELARQRESRRVVELVPSGTLPPACRGALVVPTRVDEVAPGEWRTFELSVRGPLKVLPEGMCRAECPYGGGAALRFSMPVRGAEVLRHVRLEPGLRFTVTDTAETSTTWWLHAPLKPRARYQLIVDTLLTDVFGSRLPATYVHAFVTQGVPPSVSYEYGRLLVERRGLGTLAVQHVNVDTLHVKYVQVPDSMEGLFLAQSWGRWSDGWDRLQAKAVNLRIPVRTTLDRGLVTGVRVPARARAGRGGTLVAVRVGANRKEFGPWQAPIALVQVTDLAVHARVGADQAAVWVTGVSDGLPRAGAAVEVRADNGRLRGTGRTGADGVAVIDDLRLVGSAAANAVCGDYCDDQGSAYVVASLADDRAVVGVTSYDPDLSPWRFGVQSEWGAGRWPAAGAAFTERGIYRPGEVVHAKAIVRTGPLGALLPPAPGDSLRLVFLDPEQKPLTTHLVPASRWGTASAELRVPADAALGSYSFQVQLRRGRSWLRVAEAPYQVAEYRPPEFVVDAAAPAGPLFAGDTVRVDLSARYLFGAPMGRAPVGWALRREDVWSWENRIPGLDDGWYVGGGAWWEEPEGGQNAVLASGVDTLDLTGHARLQAAVPAPPSGRPVRVTLAATVTDANRQAVTASTSAIVHPADFYIALQPARRGYLLRSGEPMTVRVLAVRPDGRRVAGVDLAGALVRREWHNVRRTRGDETYEVNELVADTVARCNVRSAEQPVMCTMTPKAGGEHAIAFSAVDPRGRRARTSFDRWVIGPGYVPWNDESRLKLQLVADKPRYTVGDTATVLIAAPFTNVEAWVTVERERVLEQRRLKLTDGSTALRFPITEALVPNAYVSVLLVRGRSARPGPLDDPGRPTLRVGYVNLRVTPERKRLAVEVKPLQPEYRPGDTARVAVHVRDAAGRGLPAEVTLWAVDEGVLSLTGYGTPDPMDLLYGERGLGLRLGSNLSTVAAQVPDGMKGGRAPGGGGGRDVNGVLRSRFRPTAFFLASVETDRNGDVVAAGALPDNLTTFRVMAVAVTEGDRYGKGEASLLATRPLVARPALPRFVRAGDRFQAGVVVNRRAGDTPVVKVVADATGVQLSGSRTRQERLEAGRGAELRFDFRALETDSATFRFDASGAGDVDAVRVAIPVRPAYHPVTHEVAGVVHDSATIEVALPDELDPARSTLRLALGSSPLAVLAGYRTALHVYPYYCSEQVSSAATPLIALYRAQKTTGTKLLEGDPAGEIRDAIAVLVRRQNETGAIGFWGRDDWSTPWLSAYAGRVLLDARAAGFPVSDAVLTKLAGYLSAWLKNPAELHVPVSPWYRDFAWLTLAERAAAADFLSRMGKPDVATENQLIGVLPRMAWEDRLLLAEMLARRGQRAAAAGIVTAALAGVRVDGHKAILPAESGRAHYFGSTARPYARAVSALLAVDPGNALLYPLVEALVDRGRVAALSPWNTQDFGNAAGALAAFWGRHAGTEPQAVRLLDGRRQVLQVTARPTSVADTVVRLGKLVHDGPDGNRLVRLTLQLPQGRVPVWYELSVREVPKGVAVNPRETGIAVERWYERVDDGRPILSAREGELVRVRLRVTSPVERHFVVLDDALPAGLEPVDLSLRTMRGFAASSALDLEETRNTWWYGSWDSGIWSAFDHKELRDDRVVYSASILWPGSTSATYLARATTAGAFAMPAAHAEEMYNPGVHGRSGGGTFTVTGAQPAVSVR